MSSAYPIINPGQPEPSQPVKLGPSLNHLHILANGGRPPPENHSETATEVGDWDPMWTYCLLESRVSAAIKASRCLFLEETLARPHIPSLLRQPRLFRLFQQWQYAHLCRI